MGLELRGGVWLEHRLTPMKTEANWTQVSQGPEA